MYVTTTNNFFKILVSIHKSFNKWRIARGYTNTKDMALKFSKYWESAKINYLLWFASLDPCFKFDYIQLCFKKMYVVDKSKEIAQKLDDLIENCFLNMQQKILFTLKVVLGVLWL